MRITMYFAVPPATLILASIDWPLVSVGAPFSVPGAKLPMPQVRALLRIDVVDPPVMIGFTVGLPAFA